MLAAQIEQANPRRSGRRIEDGCALVRASHPSATCCCRRRGADKNVNQGVQLGLARSDGDLRPAKREVVGLLAPFDDALERAVGNVRVSGPKQQQRRQDSRQATLPSWKGCISRKTTTKTAMTIRGQPLARESSSPQSQATSSRISLRRVDTESRSRTRYRGSRRRVRLPRTWLGRVFQASAMTFVPARELEQVAV